VGLFGKNKNSGHPLTKAPRNLGQGKIILVVSVILSVLIHLSSYIKIGNYSSKSGRRNPAADSQKSVPIKLSYQKKEKSPPPFTPKKILEAKQEETERPEKADHLGYVDHIAKKETKIPKEKLNPKKAADPGPQGTQATQPPSMQITNILPPADLKPPASPDSGEQKPISKDGEGSPSLAIKPPSAARNAYENLLNHSYLGMVGEVNAGYQDYINGDIEDGDRIDINTQEFRYLGYFTNMRKAIEMVWVYPSEAWRRGIQGTVRIEMTIQKTGQVTNLKVIKSSGFEVLDNAILEAIRLASPFAPLPDGFAKNRIVVPGSFAYILNGYAVSR
jgi:TonB family protein